VNAYSYLIKPHPIPSGNSANQHFLLWQKNCHFVKKEGQKTSTKDFFEKEKKIEKKLQIFYVKL
jgi:hypothetical protein